MNVHINQIINICSNLEYSMSYKDKELLIIKKSETGQSTEECVCADTESNKLSLPKRKNARNVNGIFK